MDKYDEGLKIIAGAQQAKEAGRLKDAHAKYQEGIGSLLKVVKEEKNAETSAMVRRHLDRFIGEMEELQKKLSDPASDPLAKRKLTAANATEKKAQELEKQLKFALSQKTYAEAGLLFKQYREMVEGDEKAHKQAGLKALAMVEKAEKLKAMAEAMKPKPSPAQMDKDLQDLMDLPTPPVPGQAGTGYVKPPPEEHPDVPGYLPNSLVASFVRGRGKRDKEEQQVLIMGNKINGKKYEPMFASDSDDSHFRGEQFKDPDGMPPMAQKQKAEGAVWGRPSQFMKNPVIYETFHYQSIIQTLVGDCSFVSSLAVCAGWERRFGKTLISRNIYPQKNGVPIVSPNGKYVVKMYLNGTVRKITIDDYLPVAGQPPQIVCSYSKNPNELWVSLFEKAYLKLHGGYDFPGSTSSIDLHALCGWIPETFHLQPDAADKIEPEDAWSRMIKAHSKGTALFTMGTKAMTQEEEDRTGLAEKHAYAVIDVKEVCSRRLVKLKNPWCNLRWKGDFNPNDHDNWTPELKAALKYDDEQAKEFDDGIFWISWEAVLHFFNSIHCSWTPSRFSCRRNTHGYWQKKESDKLHWDSNPQFILRVNASKKTMIWLLLHRHYISTKEEPYMALHVAKGNRRVLYRSEPLVHKGVYRNTPHYLVRLECPEGEQSFALIVSLYDDKGTLPFTLTSYSEEPAGLYRAVECPVIEAVPEAKPFTKSFKYKWQKDSAGGSLNTDKFDSNPMFRLEMKEPQRIFIKVKVGADVKDAIGLHLFASGQRVTRKDKTVGAVAGGDEYRHDLVWAEYKVLQGSYTLVVATFKAEVLGEFSVFLKAKSEIALSSLPIVAATPTPAAQPQVAQPQMYYPQPMQYYPMNPNMPYGPVAYDPNAPMVPYNPNMPYPPGMAPGQLVDPAAAGAGDAVPPGQPMVPGQEQPANGQNSAEGGNDSGDAVAVGTAADPSKSGGEDIITTAYPVPSGDGGKGLVTSGTPVEPQTAEAEKKKDPPPPYVEPPKPRDDPTSSNQDDQGKKDEKKPDEEDKKKEEKKEEPKDKDGDQKDDKPADTGGT